MCSIRVAWKVKCSQGPIARLLKLVTGCVVLDEGARLWWRGRARWLMASCVEIRPCNLRSAWLGFVIPRLKTLDYNLNHYLIQLGLPCKWGWDNGCLIVLRGKMSFLEHESTSLHTCLWLYASLSKGKYKLVNSLMTLLTGVRVTAKS